MLECYLTSFESFQANVTNFYSEWIPKYPRNKNFRAFKKGKIPWAFLFDFCSLMGMGGEVFLHWWIFEASNGSWASQKKMLWYEKCERMLYGCQNSHSWRSEKIHCIYYHGRTSEVFIEWDRHWIWGIKLVDENGNPSNETDISKIYRFTWLNGHLLEGKIWIWFLKLRDLKLMQQTASTPTLQPGYMKYAK